MPKFHVVFSYEERGCVEVEATNLTAAEELVLMQLDESGLDSMTDKYRHIDTFYREYNVGY